MKEDQNIEWKQSRRDEYLKWICGSGAGEGTGDTAQETTQETTQEKILAQLRDQPSMTHRDMAARIGISSDGIKHHLEKMKSAGSIRHVGPTKDGHWEILK